MIRRLTVSSETLNWVIMARSLFNSVGSAIAIFLHTSYCSEIYFWSSLDAGMTEKLEFCKKRKISDLKSNNKNQITNLFETKKEITSAGRVKK